MGNPAKEKLTRDWINTRRSSWKTAHRHILRRNLETWQIPRKRSNRLDGHYPPRRNRRWWSFRGRGNRRRKRPIEVQGRYVGRGLEKLVLDAMVIPQLLQLPLKLMAMHERSLQHYTVIHRSTLRGPLHMPRTNRRRGISTTPELLRVMTLWSRVSSLSFTGHLDCHSVLGGRSTTGRHEDVRKHEIWKEGTGLIRIETKQVMKRILKVDKVKSHYLYRSSK